MDAAGLLASIAEVKSHLEHRVRGQHTQIAALLSPLLLQLELLERGVQSVQQWLYFSDPAGTAHMMFCLQEVFDNVNTSTTKLHPDSLGPWLSDLHGTMLKTRLIDTRQSVSLIQFTLSVCQLPVGRESAHEIQELRHASNIFRNGHAHRDGGERSPTAELRRSLRDVQHSQDFAQFIDTFTRAEDDLQSGATFESMAVPVSTTPPDDVMDPLSPVGTLSGGWDATLDAATLESLRDQHGPPLDERDWQTTEKTRPLSRQRAVTTSWTSTRRHEEPWDNGSPVSPTIATLSRPVHVRVSSSPTSPRLTRQQILRKPVSRSGSLSSPIIPTILTRGLRANEEVTGDAFLSPPPSRASMLRPSLSTNELFEKATASLSDLAEDVQPDEGPNDLESPPPYVRREAPIPTPLTLDTKIPQASNPPTASNEIVTAIQAVRENRADLLRSMLAQGMGIEEVDSATRRTALMEAAYFRRSSMAQNLVRSGSRLHVKDTDGNTALHFAASQGDREICDLLLQAGAQLEEYNRFGDTPLMLAARLGHTDATECLLDGWTLQRGTGFALTKGFLEASKSGNVSTAEAFLSKGIKPKKIEEAWKPVAYAAQSGSLPMLDFMLAQKCQLKEKSPDGWTPLHFAARHGQTAMVEKLLALKLSWKARTKKTEETALHLSVLAGHAAASMALILHKDASITMKDADDMQALHHAVRNGDGGMTTLLLNKGAKVDETNKFGWRPIHIAVAYGHLALVAEFITRGADLEDKLKAPDVKPSRKTNEAARKGYWAEIRWPHQGARPLHLALEFAQDEVASVLIAGGAKIDQCDAKGWYPIHYAAFNCRIKLLELLLSRGASPHATTADGNTPLNLGFRVPGLMATQEDKECVWSLLQGAMNARRKSKIEQFSGFMTIGRSNSRDAGSRNKAWHTAELAAVLYQTDAPEEGEGDAESQLTPSTSSQHKIDDGAE